MLKFSFYDTKISFYLFFEAYFLFNVVLSQVLSEDHWIEFDRSVFLAIIAFFLFDYPSTDILGRTLLFRMSSDFCFSTVPVY